MFLWPLPSLSSPLSQGTACRKLLQEMVPLKRTLSQTTLPLSAVFRCGRAAQSADWGPAAAGSSFPSPAGKEKLSGPASQPVCSPASATPAMPGCERGTHTPTPLFKDSLAVQKNACVSLMTLLQSGAPWRGDLRCQSRIIHPSEYPWALVRSA